MSQYFAPFKPFKAAKLDAVLQLLQSLMRLWFWRTGGRPPSGSVAGPGNGDNGRGAEWWIAVERAGSGLSALDQLRALSGPGSTNGIEPPSR